MRYSPTRNTVLGTTEVSSVLLTRTDFILNKIMNKQIQLKCLLTNSKRILHEQDYQFQIIVVHTCLYSHNLKQNSCLARFFLIYTVISKYCSHCKCKGYYLLYLYNTLSNFYKFDSHCSP